MTNEQVFNAFRDKGIEVTIYETPYHIVGKVIIDTTEHDKQIRTAFIEECNRKLDELERAYKRRYSAEIVEMFAEVYEDFRTWLKEQK